MRLPSLSSVIPDGVTGRVSNQLATWGYEAGWSLSRRLPESVVATAFDQIGSLSTHRDGHGVQQLRKNLRRVHPELDEGALDDLVGEAMKSYLRYWREAFRLPAWSWAEIERRVEADHAHRLFDPLDDRTGVVAVLGHFGNWDHGGAWVTGQGYPLMTVAERLKPASLFDQFVEYRESLGMTVLPLTGGPDVTRLLQQRLAEGVWWRCLPIET